MIIESRFMKKLIEYFGEKDFTLKQVFIDERGIMHYTIEYDIPYEDDSNMATESVIQFHAKYNSNESHNCELVVDYHLR